MKLRKPKASRARSSEVYVAGTRVSIRCSVKFSRRPAALRDQICRQSEVRALNDLAKNVVLWIVIAVVLLAVVSNFSPRAAGRAGDAVFGIPERRQGAAAIRRSRSRAT